MLPFCTFKIHSPAELLPLHTHHNHSHRPLCCHNHLFHHCTFGNSPMCALEEQIPLFILVQIIVHVSILCLSKEILLSEISMLLNKLHYLIWFQLADLCWVYEVPLNYHVQTVSFVAMVLFSYWYSLFEIIKKLVNGYFHLFSTAWQCVFFFFTGTSAFNFPFQFLPGIWRNDVGHFIDYLKDDVQILCDIPERFTDQSELFTSIRFDSFLCFWFRAINKYNAPRSIKQIFFLYRIYKLFTSIFYTWQTVAGQNMPSRTDNFTCMEWVKD